MLRFLGRIAIKSLGIGQIDLRYILIFKKIISIHASSFNIRRQYSIVQLTTCTHMGLAHRGQDWFISQLMTEIFSSMFAENDKR